MCVYRCLELKYGVLWGCPPTSHSIGDPPGAPHVREHSTVFSLVSEYHHHPSVMHSSTHQGISLGQKIVHVRHLEKHVMEQVVYTFLG